MMQYIGARYVPIFYKNSQDPTSTLWEINVTYEPMTWVSLANGHMYISKKEVPANIGSPADNGEYWLEAGQYNAYIQQLQDQIDDMQDGSISGSLQNQIDALDTASTSLQNQINDMNDGNVSGSLQKQINDMKDGSVSGSLQDQINDLGTTDTNLQNQINIINQDKIIAIGDSYSVDASAGGTSWMTRVLSAFGNGRVHGLAVGGAGFSMTGSQKFQTILSNYVETLTTAQKNAIKQIVVLGGANDGNLLYDGTKTTTDLANDIDAFMDYCANNLPNAIVKVGFIGWHRQIARYEKYNSAKLTYSTRVALAKNGSYYANGESIMHVNSWINNVDLVHPTLVGSFYLGCFACSVINDSDWSFELSSDCILTPNSNLVSVSGITEFKAEYDNDTCQIHILGNNTNNTHINVVLSSGSNTNIARGEVIQIGTVDGSPCGGPKPSCITPVNTVYGVYGGSSVEGYGVIMLQDSKLFYKHCSAAIAASNILIPMFSMTLNLRSN